MKYFIIAIKDIKSFIFEKRLIFSILIFSIIISMYAFCFFIALNMHSVNLVNTYNSVTSRYFISNNSNSFGTDKVENIIEWINKNEYDIRFNMYSKINLNEENNDETTKKNVIQNYQGIKDNTGTSLENEDLINYDLIIGSNSIASKRVDFIGDKLEKKIYVRNPDIY